MNTQWLGRHLCKHDVLGLDSWYSHKKSDIEAHIYDRSHKDSATRTEKNYKQISLMIINAKIHYKIHANRIQSISHDRSP